MLGRLAARIGRGLGLARRLSVETSVRRLDVAVEEVVDVGVHTGTPFLYDAFPNAFFLLVDPQSGGEALMTRKPARYRFLNIGLSDAPGTLMLRETGGRSSYLDRDASTAEPVARTRETAVDTLDAVIERELQSDAIGVKIDAEGFEDRVIGGFRHQVHRVKFVMMEVTVRRRFEASYWFSDIVAMMRDRGFHFYGIMSNAVFPPPRFYDVAFLRRDDPLFAV